MGYTHYLWNFVEFYFCMGLVYKDIKSCLGYKHGFNISARNLDYIARWDFLIIKGTLLLWSWSHKSASSTPLPNHSGGSVPWLQQRSRHACCSKAPHTSTVTIQEAIHCTWHLNKKKIANDLLFENILSNILSQLKMKTHFINLFPGYKRSYFFILRKKKKNHLDVYRERMMASLTHSGHTCWSF